MTPYGVMPAPEERGTGREAGRMTDVDGVDIVFEINLDGTVRIKIATIYAFRKPDPACADFDQAKADEFTRLWFEALRQAGAQAAADDEVVDATIHAADCTGPGCEGECDG